MGWKGPRVHEFGGLYSDPQCDAGTTTAVVTYVFFRLADPEGGGVATHPPLNFQKRAVTSMAVVMDLVVTSC